MFSNLGRVLETAGATLEAVVKVTVVIGAADARPAVNAAWIACFPDPDARPARQLTRGAARRPRRRCCEPDDSGQGSALPVR